MTPESGDQDLGPLGTKKVLLPVSQVRQTLWHQSGWWFCKFQTEAQFWSLWL